MYRLIPLEVFDGSGLPVLAVDANGDVCYYNRAVCDLTGCEPDVWLGRHCWRLGRLHDPGGAPFCSRDCPVMRGAREGNVPEVRPVLFHAPARDPVHLTLLSFPMPPTRGGRSAVLHVLQRDPDPGVPGSPGAAPAAILARHITAADPRHRRLELLSRRERDILSALADGLDVRDIADRSRLSILTVRNHIQHILRKLHLHRQVDAVLMHLGRPLAPPRP